MQHSFSKCISCCICKVSVLVGDTTPDIPAEPTDGSSESLLSLLLKEVRKQVGDNRLIKR